MKPTAKSLVLDLLLAADGGSLSAHEAVRCGALFDITANNVRVTLVRLGSEGLIEAAGRGSYRLGPAAQDLAGEVATWRSAEQRVRRWNGGYIAVHCAGLGRSDRAALKRRQRALQMLGFREYEGALYLRPDNIERDLDAVRKRLVTLGLDPRAPVFLASAFGPRQLTQIERLWDRKALEASYHKLQKRLHDWIERSDGLDRDIAAREAFLIGGAAIRQLVFDPLLPAPMIDVDARQAFVETVHRFDACGRKIWAQLYRSALPTTVSSKAKRARRA